MAETRQEIEITENTRGVLAYAVSQEKYGGNWLLIIDRVVESPAMNDLVIIAHIAKRLHSTDIYVGGVTFAYLKINKMKYYTVTDKEKKELKKLLKVYNKRYIKGINRLIDR